MKKKMVLSLLVIMVAIAATVGGTLAWFTAEAEITPNVFQAGILEIDASEVWAYEGGMLENWNPGDCEEKVVTVEVTGTKRAYIRMEVTETWTLLDENGVPLPIETYKTRNAPNINWDWTASDWQLISDANGDYFYYLGMLDPNEIDGPISIEVLSEVCLAGAETGNEYQGATYTLAINFEAIQVTNDASGDAWGYVFNGTEWVAY